MEYLLNKKLNKEIKLLLNLNKNTILNIINNKAVMELVFLNDNKITIALPARITIIAANNDPRQYISTEQYGGSFNNTKTSIVIPIATICQLFICMF